MPKKRHTKSTGLKRGGAKLSAVNPRAAKSKKGGLNTEGPTLSTRVEARLQHALMAGQLRPNQRLTIAEIAAAYGTSITPVREALLRLAAIGAIEFRRATSVSVPMLDEAGYIEICEIRKALEGFAAERAAALCVPDDIAELARIFDEYHRAKSTRDVAQALELNWRFRFKLYQCAAMPRLMEQIRNNWLLIGPLFNFLYPAFDPERAYEAEYASVIDGLTRRDGAAVRAAVVRAIDVGSERVRPFIRSVALGQTGLGGELWLS